MKKNYTNPELEVTVLEVKDILTSSNEVDIDGGGLYPQG